MAFFFADEMQAVASRLVVAVAQNHEAHTHRDKEAEKRHRQRHREVALNEKRIDAEHHENRRIFVEILHGDGAPGAPEFVT